MMLHLGDITKINGAEIEPVDYIAGGSPCQDLSVAGKRAGLEGERSGLFMEQIRIIKEMRERDKQSGRTDQHIRPRYMVWENVPGVFSSNKAEDFRIVLEETARVAEADVSIPRPPKKWANAGCVMGDGWSIAWRVLDAQFWGVPQRRRRIALVADFGGESAPEILFIEQGVSWDIAESGAEGQGIAADAADCFKETGVGFDACQHHNWRESDTIGPLTTSSSVRGDTPLAMTYCIQGNIARGAHEGQNGIGVQEDVSYTLNTIDIPAVCAGFKLEQGAAANGLGYQDEMAPTLSAMDSGNKPDVLDMTHACDVIRECGDIVPSLQARMGTGGNQIPLVMAHGQANAEITENQAPTPNCNHERPIVCLNKFAYNCGENAQGSMNITEDGIAPTHGCDSHPPAVATRQSVRRLTPLECERLQGYPDGWTDIGEYTDSKGKRKQSSDSARYKALGNSIALPPWRHVLGGIHRHGARTLGSLFDGIGGFPLICKELGGEPLWASEIEEFPIAVTKMRFEVTQCRDS